MIVSQTTNEDNDILISSYHSIAIINSIGKRLIILSFQSLFNFFDIAFLRKSIFENPSWMVWNGIAKLNSASTLPATVTSDIRLILLLVLIDSAVTLAAQQIFSITQVSSKHIRVVPITDSC